MTPQSNRWRTCRWLVLAIIVWRIGTMSSEGMAATAKPLDSSQLREVVVVRGVATVTESAVPGSGESPTRFKRHFEVRQLHLIRGAAKLGESLAFEGATEVGPTSRDADVWSPALRLEGEAFLQRALPAAAVPVLLLIGGPPAGGELAGSAAQVVSPVLRGQPVRAFLLEGADRALGEAIVNLVGWQADPRAAAQKALEGGHPLLAMDALRVLSARPDAVAQVEGLAKRLTHPAQPAAVRAGALSLVATALQRQAPGSKEANALVGVLLTAYEGERRVSVEAAVLEALTAAAPQVRGSDRVPAARGVATNSYLAQRLAEKQRQLAAALGK